MDYISRPLAVNVTPQQVVAFFLVQNGAKNGIIVFAMKPFKKSREKFLFYAIVSVWIVFVFALFFFIVIVPKISRKKNLRQEEEGLDKNYHVLVLGESDAYVFLSQVFQGAESLAKNYNALVELKVPRSEAENLSLLELMDYASFVNADGIIVAVSAESPLFQKAYRNDGTEIPVITIGHYSDKNPQVSFIGYNYSALGRKIGEESLSLFNQNGKSYVVISSPSSGDNHIFSNLLNSIVNFYREKGISNFEILSKSLEENAAQVQEILSAEWNKDSALICLTEMDCMATLHLVSAKYENQKIKILGFGENETISTFLEKGILTKRVSFDPQKIGQEAMRELFEYRNKGYANSYITAELLVQDAKSFPQKIQPKIQDEQK